MTIKFSSTLFSQNTNSDLHSSSQEPSFAPCLFPPSNNHTSSVRNRSLHLPTDAFEALLPGRVNAASLSSKCLVTSLRLFNSNTYLKSTLYSNARSTRSKRWNYIRIGNFWFPRFLALIDIFLGCHVRHGTLPLATPHARLLISINRARSLLGHWFQSLRTPISRSWVCSKACSKEYRRDNCSIARGFFGLASCCYEKI